MTDLTGLVWFSKALHISPMYWKKVFNISFRVCHSKMEPNYRYQCRQHQTMHSHTKVRNCRIMPFAHCLKSLFEPLVVNIVQMSHSVSVRDLINEGHPAMTIVIEIWSQWMFLSLLSKCCLVVIATSRSAIKTLETASYHDVYFVITRGTGSCRYDNLSVASDNEIGIMMIIGFQCNNLSHITCITHIT